MYQILKKLKVMLFQKHSQQINFIHTCVIKCVTWDIRNNAKHNFFILNVVILGYLN